MRVIVVGGGIGGLACAHALAERGHEVTLLEREPRTGGKLFTDVRDGWQVECGPFAVLDNAPDTEALVKELDLAGERVLSDDAARRRFVWLEGALREVPDSPPKLLASRTLSLGDKLRVFGEPLARRAPAGVDESIAAYARRRVGARIAERFVEPMVSGVFAGDWEQLSLKSAFPRLAELEAHGGLLRGLIALERARKAAGQPRVPARLSTFRGGMSALAQALTARLSGRVRSGAAVESLVREGAGFRVRSGGEELTAERVVLALPPAEAAALTRPLDAALGDAFAAIPAASIAAVSLGWPRAQVGHPLDGFGFLVPHGASTRGGPALLGAIFSTSTFPGVRQAPPEHVLLRCLVGGARDPQAALLSDEALVARARAALATSLGLTAAPVFTHVVRWQKAIPQYVIGHADRVAAVEARGQAIGLYATGSALRGVGVNDVIRDARAIAARLG